MKRNKEIFLSLGWIQKFNNWDILRNGKGKRNCILICYFLFHRAWKTNAAQWGCFLFHFWRSYSERLGGSKSYLTFETYRTLWLKEEDSLVSLHCTNHQLKPGNKRRLLLLMAGVAKPAPVPSELALPRPWHLHMLHPSPKQVCSVEGPIRGMFIKDQSKN